MASTEVEVMFGDLDAATLQTLKDNGITTLNLMSEFIQHENYFKELVPCMATRLQIILKNRQIQNEIEKFTISDTDDTIKTTTTNASEDTIIEEEPPKKVYILEKDGQLRAAPCELSPLGDRPVDDAQEKTQLGGSHYIMELDKELNLIFSNKPNASTSGSAQSKKAPSISNSSSNLINLDELLKSSLTGKAIKSYYQKNRELDTRCQSYLTDIIVEKLINQTPFRRHTNADFQILADDIGNYFPKESSLVYFTPPIAKRHSKERKSVIARGKLVDKYRNKLSFLRKAGAVGMTQDDEEDEEELSDHIYDENADVIWLKHNRQPWTDVQEKWRKTNSHRVYLIKNRKTELKEVLDTYPILSHDLGYVLIDMDFQKSFGQIYQKIYENFESVFFTMLELKKKCLNPSDHILVKMIYDFDDENSKNSRHLLMLNVLFALLPTKSYNKKLVNNWHPTLNDAKEGIIVEIKASSEIEQTIAQRRSVMKKHGLPMLPFIIVEAPTYKEVRSIYVSFDEILYSVVSVVKAVDVCFQMIHVLNLVYPYQAEHLWLFIQRAMYGLKTKFDNIPNIIDITNKVENKLNP